MTVLVYGTVTYPVEQTSTYLVVMTVTVVYQSSHDSVDGVGFDHVTHVLVDLACVVVGHDSHSVVFQCSHCVLNLSSL